MAGFLVNGESHDVIRALIRYEEEPSVRIDGKIARPVALCPNMLDELELAIAPVYLEHDDAIVPAV